MQLAIAGNGANKKHLESIIHHYGLEDQVKFLGFIPNEDLPALLNVSDIFTMPSEAELLSIASLEAMACGKPLLLANAKALPELVHNGMNGFLFEPGSSIDAAKKIDILLERKQNWKIMGEHSLQMVQAHTIENTISGYTILYEYLINGQGMPDPIKEWMIIRPGSTINSSYA
jgi:glycosyltransferase involved in cell wall biosynthesis